MSASVAPSVPELLGLRKHAHAGSSLGLMSDVEKGLPLSALDRIVHAVAPDDASFAYRLVPRATLARRRAQHAPRLTPEESARVARLASVWAFARDVWGDEQGARRWMFASSYDAGGSPPDRCCACQRVRSSGGREYSWRLKYGTAV